MSPKARLALIGLLILGSAVYAFLVSVSPELARTIMLGYIGLALTIIVITTIWKKPHDR